MKKSLVMGILVVAILLLGAVGYAAAETVAIPGVPVGGHLSATGPVTVSATVNAKLLLTIQTPDPSQSVVFPALDPMTASGSKTVTLTVSSNKTYDVQIDKTDAGIAAMGLSTTLAASPSNATTASKAFPDNYSISVPWTTPAGPLTALVKYTVVQN